MVDSYKHDGGICPRFASPQVREAYARRELEVALSGLDIEEFLDDSPLLQEAKGRPSNRAPSLYVDANGDKVYDRGTYTIHMPAEPDHR